MEKQNKQMDKVNLSLDMFNSHYPVPILALNVITTLLSLGIVILSATWCVYYLHHAMMVKRKIKSLKKYTEHNERERYINAVIEYKKSLFIVTITFAESWLPVAYWAVVTFVIFENDNNNSTTRPEFVYYIQKYPTFEVLVVWFISLFILMGSLVSILTAYLIKAYGTERETNLNEKQLFVWMFLQLLIGWVLGIIPRINEIAMPIYNLGIFIGQIVVYVRLSRKLYAVLRRRREDTYFEDREMHPKMVRMCNDFKYGVIAYTIVLLLFLSELAVEMARVYFDTIFLDNKSILHEYLDPVDVLRTQHMDILMEVTLALRYIAKVIALLMLAATFMLHFAIIVKIIVNYFERKRNMKNQMQSVSDVLAPLMKSQ